MPIPTHGPSCQTLIYDTSCWHCQRTISVLQCTCGSAVLFDERGPPWPEHSCAGGIGGSGLSGWEAVDTLRALGMPISKDVIDKKIFSPGRQPSPQAPSEITIKRIEPESRKRRTLLAVVRELKRSTKQTKDIEALPAHGYQILGLDPETSYRQITLVNNSIRPNESFTALIPDHMARSLKCGMIVKSEVSGSVYGNFANWIVTDITPL